MSAILVEALLRIYWFHVLLTHMQILGRGTGGMKIIFRRIIAKGTRFCSAFGFLYELSWMAVKWILLHIGKFLT